MASLEMWVKILKSPLKNIKMSNKSRPLQTKAIPLYLVCFPLLKTNLENKNKVDKRDLLKQIKQNCLI